MKEKKSYQMLEVSGDETRYFKQLNLPNTPLKRTRKTDGGAKKIKCVLKLDHVIFLYSLPFRNFLGII